MRSAFVTAAALGLAILASQAQADDAAINAALARVFPGQTADAVRPTPVPGISEVVMGGQVFYLSEDGNYLFHGSLVALGDMTNLTAERQNELRRGLLAGIPDSESVIFRAPEERHVVTVFTDIDCGYCRKLHDEMDAINARGVSVRYLFFPRSGPGTRSWAKAESVWCAEDRQAALTAAKNGKDPESRRCDNPLHDHFDMVQALDLTGTPAIVLENGRLVPGYVPADKLARLADQAVE